MNFHGIRFIMKLWLLERTSLGYGHTWTSWPSIMNQTSFYLLLEQKKRERKEKKKERKGAQGGEPWAASKKKIRGSLIFWGKSFGTWEKIWAMGSCQKINLWAAWSLFHLRQSKGEVDWAIWLCCHGDVESATWQCGLGNMDLRIGHYKVCDVAKWTCQHGLGNWVLGTLWFGKVHLAPWTWQLGATDFVIWQMWTWQMSIPYLCMFLFSLFMNVLGTLKDLHIITFLPYLNSHT